MITWALVLHLWHMVALGGKLAPSPVTAMSSSWSAVLLGMGAGAEATPPRPSPSLREREGAAAALPGTAVTSLFF